MRHSLRVKNNDPQSNTPRDDGAWRRYGKGAKGGGRGGEGPEAWSRGRRGSTPRRLERVEEREEAKDKVMDSRSAGRGRGHTHVDGGVDASVFGRPRSLEAQISTLQRKKGRVGGMHAGERERERERRLSTTKK